MPRPSRRKRYDRLTAALHLSSAKSSTMAEMGWPSPGSLRQTWAGNRRSTKEGKLLFNGYAGEADCTTELVPGLRSGPIMLRRRTSVPDSWRFLQNCKARTCSVTEDTSAGCMKREFVERCLYRP